jgi:hypothetical protein
VSHGVDVVAERCAIHAPTRLDCARRVATCLRSKRRTTRSREFVARRSRRARRKIERFVVASLTMRRNLFYFIILLRLLFFSFLSFYLFLDSRATLSVNGVLDLLSPASEHDALARDALDVDRKSIDVDVPLPVRKRLQHVIDEAERVIRFAAISASKVGTVGLDNAGVLHKKRN